MIDLLNYLETHSLHVGIFILFVVGFVRDYYQRRAIDESVQFIHVASMALVKPYTVEVERQGQDVRECREELEALRVQVERLELGILTILTQLYKAGIRPDWLPPGWTVPP